MSDIKSIGASGWRCGERGPRGHRGHRGHDGRDGSDNSRIVFRPGAPDDSAANVFSTWADTYEAIRRINGEDARSGGTILLEVDDRFGPCNIPPGTWNLSNVIPTCTVKGSTPSHPATLLTLEDGAKFVLDPSLTVITIEGENFNICSDRVGPVIPFEGINLLLTGNRVRLINTSALALPMVVRQNAVGAVNFVANSGNNAFGGIGNGIACPAPVIDCRGGTFLFGGASGFVGDNALTDSVGGGTIIMRMMSDGFTGGSYPGQTYSYPALFSGGGAMDFSVEARDRQRVSALITTTPYAATFNELVRVDSTAGPCTVQLPRANPAKGERVTVIDEGGTASTNAITIVGTGGDTVSSGSITTDDQAKTWRSNGSGKWRLISQT